MMTAKNLIKTWGIEAVQMLYSHAVDDLLVNEIGSDRLGDYSLVVFPLVKILKLRPEDIGHAIGAELVKRPEIEEFEVIKGFLNITLADEFLFGHLARDIGQDNFGHKEDTNQTIVVEYASPNTNKPIHLGHIRNILLGWSIANILETQGYKVIRTQIVNDRGIAICKSMVAWSSFGGKSPEEEGLKGDFLVGKYYVLFNKKLEEEYLAWQKGQIGSNLYIQSGQVDNESDFFIAYKNQYFNTYSNLGRQSREMLIQWEEGKTDVRDLWSKMNDWVYQGFDETYNRLGIRFDKSYYESDTYLLGRDMVRSGVDSSVFFVKDDDSIWIDLEDANLDQKLVLRSDGTSVYLTQDLGTARLRYEDFSMDSMVYVVGDEQNYHFKVLFEVLKRMGESYADRLHHLSYGMVDLPSGKMKGREGTVVEADTLMDEVLAKAQVSTKERGVLDGLSSEELSEINRRIAMAALKFFIIKVQPQKRMTFDPKESVELQGQTGPYIQNAYVRIQSILRKVDASELDQQHEYVTLNGLERALILSIDTYPEILEQAAREFDPSIIANYSFDLAKTFHRFFHEHQILNAPEVGAKTFRLQLANMIGQVLKDAMNVLGIQMPEKM